MRHRITAIAAGARSDWKALLLFVSAFADLLAIAAFSARAVRQSTESSRWLLHTSDVLDNLQGAVLSLQSIESACRGYLLTGDEAYLKNFDAGIAMAKRRQAAIRILTADNPIQQRLLPVLDAMIARDIQTVETLNAVRRARGLDAAVAATRAARNPAQADAYRPIIGRMQREELRLLAIRKQAAALARNRAEDFLLLGTAVSLLIAGIAGWIVRYDGTRRRMAEKTLQHRDGQYRALIHGVQDYGIVMLDRSGIFLSSNPGVERMTGCSSQELVGSNFSRFFAAEARVKGRPQAILRLAAANGVYEELGIRYRRDGNRFRVRSTFTALRDAAGDVRSFSVVSRNLTEQTDSDAKYRGLLEAAPDAMVVVNQDGEIVLLNVQAEKRFGYTRDELLGQKVTNIIPDGFAERLIADGTRTAAEALGQQIGTGIELTGLRKDGGEFPIEIMLSPLENAEGILVTAAIRDISVRKTAEQHLAHMESRYRGLLEAAPDAMVVVDQKGMIVLLNLQAEKRFGYTRDELLGQQVKNIIPVGFAERLIADDLRSAEDALAQQIGTGIELTGLRKDGGEFPIEIMLSPLRSADGTLVTAAIRDISVRRDMETQNAQLHAKLRHAEKMEAIGTLAGGVAHELNNLLQPIIMMTELVMTGLPQDGQQVKQLLRVVDAGGKAAEIVQRILAFGRVDEATYDALNAGLVVDDAIAFIRTILPTSITLHVDNIDSRSQDGTIRGNKTQLTQILMNMATNARDAIAANVGTVWISVSRLEAGDARPAVRIGAVQPGPYVVLTVRDSGSGMDERTMARIFEPFFTTKGVGKGTGLGLSISHGIITGHGGAMQVDSLPGCGTKFSIYLPIEAPTPILALAS